VPDAVVRKLAIGVAGQLGGQVGIAPRLFLRRLVDLLDRVEAHADFDPEQHYEPVLQASELTAEEAAAAGIERNVDDIALDLGEPDA
jgi:hypothetical protein